MNTAAADWSPAEARANRSLKSPSSGAGSLITSCSHGFIGQTADPVIYPTWQEIVRFRIGDREDTHICGTIRLIRLFLTLLDASKRPLQISAKTSFLVNSNAAFRTGSILFERIPLSR